MSGSPVDGPLWRVGYHRAPVDFTPLDLYGFSHRFGDVDQRFRTLYLAEFEVTSLREVLADFRPNLAARQRHIERYGPEAADDFPVAPVTAKWHQFDADTRQELEDRHAALLVEYGLEHLDLSEITTKRRKVTQTIASDLFDRGAAAVQFPSRLDGKVCIALFEGRGIVHQAGDVVALTDPPPDALLTVTGEWKLKMQKAS
ncbi:hypothetical protein MSIMFI_01203 [Mycobacterium simulans]|uniref:RES family NAD+ phosphorylase n=1 Tax=Mycobacterium simulans TaxID=627089 RepID=UPI00174BD26D|nr:RES family NAD+ phosphorylase [Mycobacterium simulans]SON59719.1 hypothetical protein MSIMFI_01203 [Mycobacterium simulans]